MGNMNSRYFATKPRENIPSTPWDPVFKPDEATRLMYLDKTVLDGAFYLECAWFWPGEWPGDKNWSEHGVKAHSHDYDEVIAFFGTDTDEPSVLGAEVELWLEDEKHIITKSSLVFIPAGMKHCPLTFLKIDRPVFHFTTGPGKTYF